MTLTQDNGPIDELPESYIEAEHLVLTKAGMLFWLNVLSLLLIVPFFILMVVWSGLVVEVRGPFPSEVLASVPVWVYWIATFMVLPLHELVHGLAIRWAGHKPRYGWKTFGVGPLRVPLALFATADGAYFRRDEFLIIALAPLVVITLAGLILVPVVPDVIGIYVSVAVMLNGGGAIGDIWMSVVCLGYPRSALVKDEADSIRVYVGPNKS